jgi:hypothetical protein
MIVIELEHKKIKSYLQAQDVWSHIYNIVSFSKAAKIREKCMVVQPNHTFFVFLAI